MRGTARKGDDWLENTHDIFYIHTNIFSWSIGHAYPFERAEHTRAPQAPPLYNISSSPLINRGSSRRGEEWWGQFSSGQFRNHQASSQTG